MFCRKCGSQVQDGSKFCLKCGNPMAEQSAPPVQPASQPAPQPTFQPVQGFGQPSPYDPAAQAAMFTNSSTVNGKVIAAVIAIVLVVVGIVIGVIAAVSGGDSGSGGGSGGASSLEEACERAVSYIGEGDSEAMLKLAFPQDVIEHACDVSGLDEEKLAKKYIGRDSYFKSAKETVEDYEAEYKDISYEEEAGESYYKSYRKAFSASGIKDRASEILFVTIALKGERRSINGIGGIAYELDGEWYFGLSDYLSSLVKIASESDKD